MVAAGGTGGLRLRRFFFASPSPSPSPSALPFASASEPALCSPSDFSPSSSSAACFGFCLAALCSLSLLWTAGALAFGCCTSSASASASSAASPLPVVRRCLALTPVGAPNSRRRRSARVSTRSDPLRRAPYALPLPPAPAPPAPEPGREETEEEEEEEEAGPKRCCERAGGGGGGGLRMCLGRGSKSSPSDSSASDVWRCATDGSNEVPALAARRRCRRCHALLCASALRGAAVGGAEADGE